MRFPDIVSEIVWPAKDRECYREHFMSPSDEQELHRVSALLAAIYGTLPASSPLREGLVKAGLALSFTFMHGRRSWIENTYAHLNDPLSEEQRAHLISLGIDPEA